MAAGFCAGLPYCLIADLDLRLISSQSSVDIGPIGHIGPIKQSEMALHKKPSEILNLQFFYPLRIRLH